MDCDFCPRLNGEMPERPWYDFSVVGKRDEFYTVLALGALTPGHVMLVTRSHVECMAQLSGDNLINLTSAVDYWTHAISEVWERPCFVFEHGGPSYSCASGACITHAHLQLLPLSVNPIRDEARFESFASLPEALMYARQSGYLLYAWDGWFHVMRDGHVPGQFFRRRIAGVLGQPDEWDYLAYPNYHYITIGKDRLSSYISRVRAAVTDTS